MSLREIINKYGCDWWKNTSKTKEIVKKNLFIDSTNIQVKPTGRIIEFSKESNIVPQKLIDENYSIINQLRKAFTDEQIREILENQYKYIKFIRENE